MLESLVKEFGDTFPEFKRVLIDERDMYLTHSLQKASQPIPNDLESNGFIPACVVGVVGLGHCNGIKRNWDKQIDISQIIKTREIVKNYSVGKYGKYLKYSMLFGVISVIGFQYFKK